MLASPGRVTSELINLIVKRKEAISLPYIAIDACYFLFFKYLCLKYRREFAGFTIARDWTPSEKIWVLNHCAFSTKQMPRQLRHLGSPRKLSQL